MQLPATRNEWYTPPEIFRALGCRFDLDPAAPPGGAPWVPADRHYTYVEDGLRQPWEGRVWLNPPYGDQTGRWMRRLAEHGDGIGLVFARTDTDWWQAAAARADLIVMIKQRVRFVPMQGMSVGLGRSPDSASCLLAYGHESASIARLSGLGLAVMPEAIGLTPE